MPNVLTNLAADIYKAADIVGRELTGAIASSTINANGSERVAVGGVVRSSFAPPATAVDTVAAMIVPEGTDQTIANKTATISKSKAVQIPWAGEDMKSVNNGMGFETIYGDQIAQAMRTLTNLIEADATVELARNASRAFGTAGTNPFTSDHYAINEARQILVDNGCPANDGRLSMVMNTTAGTKLRNLTGSWKVNESGQTALLRQGVLQDISGIMLRETGSGYAHTKGTGAGFLVNNVSGYAKGAQSIAVDTGTGTIVAGDILTFAGDNNKYVVGTALSGGTLSLNETGLMQALADNTAITVGNSYLSNVIFHQAAHEIIMRPPAVPQGGDAADDAMIVQDPRSGLVFEIRVYKGYRKAMFEVAIAWGVKAWLPKYIAAVLG